MEWNHLNQWCQPQSLKNTVLVGVQTALTIIEHSTATLESCEAGHYALWEMEFTANTVNLCLFRIVK